MQEYSLRVVISRNLEARRQMAGIADEVKIQLGLKFTHQGNTHWKVTERIKPVNITGLVCKAYGKVGQNEQ